MTTVNILGTEYKVIREPFKDKDRIIVNIYWKFILFCSTGGDLRCL